MNDRQVRLGRWAKERKATCTELGGAEGVTLFRDIFRLLLVKVEMQKNPSNHRLVSLLIRRVFL